MARPSNSGSQPGTPAVIRHKPTGDNRIDWAKLVPAFLASGVIHIVFALLIFLSDFVGFIALWSVSTDALAAADAVESRVDDEVNTRDKDLSMDEIGNDPSIQTMYNVDRLEDVSVPGPVTSGAVGILNAPTDVPPMTVAPPPGLGGGQGGGVDDPNKSGKASMFGTAGGFGGAVFVPGGTGGRSGATREKMLREGGGNTQSEAAVAAGLGWLSSHQATDGRWSLHNFNQAGKCSCDGRGKDNDLAGTGLGLLPFLGAGETHKGTSQSHKYSKVVERGLKWLIAKQAADGQLGEGYAHGINAICLCEAYGLTMDPWLKGPAQRSINCIVAWQAPDGGFRYAPRIPGDTSVTGWHVQALKSAQLAGLNVPKPTMQGVNVWLDTVSNPEGSGYGYQDNKTAPTVTAIALLCRMYQGWGIHSAGLVKGTQYLGNYPPVANTGPVPPAGTDFKFPNIYYYYYATQVVHQMGGASWERWNPQVRDMLIKKQDSGKINGRTHQKGSWSVENDAWPQLGRLGYTSLAVLTLEVYYRHLPLYRRELGSTKDEPVRNAL